MFHVKRISFFKGISTVSCRLKESKTTGEGTMKNFYLIDGDNNINLGLRGIEMLTEENYVMIFHSKAMEITKFKKKLSGCRAQVEFIESVRGGKNSLDFQITTELGFLSQQKDLERAYIISCDKGYDAAVEYVNRRYKLL